MNNKVHTACRLLSVLSMLLTAGAVIAQRPPVDAYAAKPLTMLIPAAAGGATELETRMYTQKITENTGQQIIYDYRPGAGSTIGYAYVAKAAPDGYMLLMTTSSFTISPYIHKNLAYNHEKDFAPVSLMSKRPYLLVVHPSLPARSVKEYIAYAKANPGAINFATTGVGGAIHLAGAWLHHASGINTTYVHYKGASAIYTDLNTGRVQATLAQPMSALPSLKTGKLLIIGVSTTERLALFPDIATAAEQGATGYNYSGWLGYMAPGATPVAILNRLSAELAKVAKSPDIARKLTEEGSIVVGSTVEQFRQHIAKENDSWRSVIRDIGIKLEE